MLIHSRRNIESFVKKENDAYEAEIKKALGEKKEESPITEVELVRFPFAVFGYTKENGVLKEIEPTPPSTTREAKHPSNVPTP